MNAPRQLQSSAAMLIRRTSRCIFWTSTLGCFLTAPAAAFKIFPAEMEIHQEITVEALQAVSVKLSTGANVTFDPLIRQAIANANASQDLSRFASAKVHFDDERFGDASQRLLDMRAAVVQHALSNRFGFAELALGMALHTLQDYYSHTNWVDTNKTAFPNFALGFLRLADPIESSAGCTARGFVPNAQLTSGYFSLTQIPTTTEWWTNDTVYGTVGLWPLNKCIHGSTEGAGIHKDLPGRPFHAEARAAALSSSIAYVRTILSEIREQASTPQVADYAQCVLLTGAPCQIVSSIAVTEVSCALGRHVAAPDVPAFNWRIKGTATSGIKFALPYAAPGPNYGVSVPGTKLITCDKWTGSALFASNHYYCVKLDQDPPQTNWEVVIQSPVQGTPFPIDGALYGVSGLNFSSFNSRLASAPTLYLTCPGNYTFP